MLFKPNIIKGPILHRNLLDFRCLTRLCWVGERSELIGFHHLAVLLVTFIRKCALKPGKPPFASFAGSLKMNDWMIGRWINDRNASRGSRMNNMEPWNSLIAILNNASRELSNTEEHLRREVCTVKTVDDLASWRREAVKPEAEAGRIPDWCSRSPLSAVRIGLPSSKGYRISVWLVHQLYYMVLLWAFWRPLCNCGNSMAPGLTVGVTAGQQLQYIPTNDAKTIKCASGCTWYFLNWQCVMYCADTKKTKKQREKVKELSHLNGNSPPFFPAKQGEN